MPINSFDNYLLSWKPDRASLKTPFYRTLSAQLEDDIRKGNLAPGTMLPPQRELADYLDINYTTITRVYDLCKKKGLIYGIVGRGTFVCSKLPEEDQFSEEISAAKGIDLGVIGGFDSQSQSLDKATRAVLAKGVLQKAPSHVSVTGEPHHLMAGRRWLEQFGVQVDQEHLMICSGAQNALTISLIALFSPGDRIATDEYTYSNFCELCSLLHLSLVPIAGDEKGMDPDALSAACHQKKIRGIYLMPVCANPTTITIPHKRRLKLAQVIEQEELIVLEDDISSCFFIDGKMAPLPSFFQLLPKQSLYISSTTKSISGSLRIAYLAFCDALRPKLLHGLRNIEIRASILDAEIVTELILSGEANSIIKRKKDHARRANELFDFVFPEEVCESREAFSLFRWLKLPKGLYGKNEVIEEELAALGISIYHSVHFTQLPNPENDYLRVSLSAAPNLRQLEKGLRILRNYLYDSNEVQA